MENTQTINTLIFKKSWFAYAKELIYFTFFSLIIFGLLPLVKQNFSNMEWIIYGFFILLLIKLFLKLYELFVFSLIINQEGVFISSGIFPWNKGIMGAHWENIGVAYYETGFINWITKAYPVKVENKFTQKFDVYASHIHRGDNCVSEINFIISNIRTKQA